MSDSIVIGDSDCSHRPQAVCGPTENHVARHLDFERYALLVTRSLRSWSSRLTRRTRLAYAARCGVDPLQPEDRLREADHVAVSTGQTAVNPLIELEHLCALFPESDGEPLYARAEHVARESTPEPYHQMLVHEHHMTVTMESYHQTAVDVEVVDSRFEEELYCRKILLKKHHTDAVVQFGIVRFNFCYVTDSVREQIESESIPLGRVLIQHNVLRHIDLGAIVKFEAGPGLSRYLQMDVGQETFGRMATIFCNGAPAVDLLEISAPLT